MTRILRDSETWRLRSSYNNVHFLDFWSLTVSFFLGLKDIFVQRVDLACSTHMCTFPYKTASLDRSCSQRCLIKGHSLRPAVLCHGDNRVWLYSSIIMLLFSRIMSKQRTSFTKHAFSRYITLSVVALRDSGSSR